MICPDNGDKSFDEFDCQECQWFYQCMKMFKYGNLWGTNNPTGDNYPDINNGLPSFIVNGICEKDCMTICNLGYACDSCPYNRKPEIKRKVNKSPVITTEELMKFKIELGEIIYFSEWEKRLDDKSN